MVNRKGQRLPDFIGVGAIRTGTTWLHEQLRRHTVLPVIKETRFFDLRYDRGLPWYSRQFRRAQDGQLVGEFCPTYFAAPVARERIRRDLPACKIIVTLRDPVERAYSYFKMLVHCAHMPNVPFEQALAINPRILGWSRYATHLAGWFEDFGRDNILVCIYDDLVTDRQGYLDRICEFIGIPGVKPAALNKKVIKSFEVAPKSPFLARVALNVRQILQTNDWFRFDAALDHAGIYWLCRSGGEPFPPLQSKLAAQLNEELLTEIEALEQLINRDLSSWKSPPSRLPAPSQSTTTTEARAV